MTNGGNGSVFESMVDHSLWGGPWVVEGLHRSLGGPSGAQPCSAILRQVTGRAEDRVWLGCASRAWFNVGTACFGPVSLSQGKTRFC